MKTCIVCEEVISEGLTIERKHICSACETNMIHTAVHKQKYKYYMQKLKKLQPIYRV